MSMFSNRTKFKLKTSSQPVVTCSKLTLSKQIPAGLLQKPKIPNSIPQEHSENLTFILLTDIISRHFPVNPSFFVLQYLKLAEYPWQPNFSNHT